MDSEFFECIEFNQLFDWTPCSRLYEPSINLYEPSINDNNISLNNLTVFYDCCEYRCNDNRVVTSYITERQLRQQRARVDETSVLQPQGELAEQCSQTKVCVEKGKFQVKDVCQLIDCQASNKCQRYAECQEERERQDADSDTLYIDNTDVCKIFTPSIGCNSIKTNDCQTRDVMYESERFNFDPVGDGLDQDVVVSRVDRSEDVGEDVDVCVCNESWDDTELNERLRLNKNNNVNTSTDGFVTNTGAAGYTVYSEETAGNKNSTNEASKKNLKVDDVFKNNSNRETSNNDSEVHGFSNDSNRDNFDQNLDIGAFNTNFNREEIKRTSNDITPENIPTFTKQRIPRPTATADLNKTNNKRLKRDSPVDSRRLSFAFDETDKNHPDANINNQTEDEIRKNWRAYAVGLITKKRQIFKRKVDAMLTWSLVHFVVLLVLVVLAMTCRCVFETMFPCFGGANCKKARPSKSNYW